MEVTYGSTYRFLNFPLLFDLQSYFKMSNPYILRSESLLKEISRQWSLSGVTILQLRTPALTPYRHLPPSFGLPNFLFSHMGNKVRGPSWQHCPSKPSCPVCIFLIMIMSYSSYTEFFISYFFLQTLPFFFSGPYIVVSAFSSQMFLSKNYVADVKLGKFQTTCVTTVSYTHLDVYKRQI